MTDSDNNRRHAIALFRYGLIADLVQLPPGAKGLYRRFEEKATAEYAGHPAMRGVRPSGIAHTERRQERPDAPRRPAGPNPHRRRHTR